jgi:CheY-like chemotaxis protein
MSGLEVIKKIKQINNKILVIAQTAYAMNENRTQCISAGADDYIAKPIDKMNFLQMIKKHLND